MTDKKPPSTGKPEAKPAGRPENPYLDGDFYNRVRDYTERDATFSKELKAIADRGAGKQSTDARFAPSLDLLRGVVKKGVSLNDMLERIVLGKESALWEAWLATFGIELRGVSYDKAGPRNARLALDLSLNAKANPLFSNEGVRNWRSLVAEDCAQVQVEKPTVETAAKAYAIFFLDAAE
ncbi:hypothetical protein [Massilia yuzhufengensis]|uniref:Uncharacterized protein n=1 Tax=Massilia yuzhufengensis TaxID=1164594 RepID=A0A1I1K5Z1_9BURK|nr:hypothetical protein [Massilia yuzhufengensis]SFC52970.1 hypothetical protein SAMN05216204_10759 [Massilia yuzhufengensis]